MSQPSVAEIFETMSYGPAPESAAPAQAWLAAHAPHLGLFIGGEWRAPSGGEYFASVNPATGQAADRHRPGHRQGCGRRRARRARGLPRVERDAGARARALSLRDRPPDPEALAPARRAGDDGQRQADPRDARHRHSAGGAALLPPRRLGAADGERAARYGAGRRRRADHPLELPAADAGLEDRARARRWATRWCSSPPSSPR